MTDKYCPRGEMKKLESELLNLRVKSNDVVSYNQHFQEMALCVRMFPEESDKIERYGDGFLDVIHESVVASRPKTMQEVIETTNELRIKGTTPGLSAKLRTKENLMTLPEMIKANNNNITRDKILAGLTLQDLVKRNGTEDLNLCALSKGNGTSQKPTCYECGSQGHFRKDCPKFKNNNRADRRFQTTVETLQVKIRELWVADRKLQAQFIQGVAKALAARDADRNMNGDDSHVSRTGSRRTERVTRECTYPDFMNALTWWNSHVMTVGPDVAYAMTWVDLKKKMTDKYCPRGEMKKLKNKIKRYGDGFLDVIHESVVASRPKMMQEVIETANELRIKGTTSGLSAKLRTKENLMTLPEMIKANNNNITRDKILAGLTLQDLVKRNGTEDLNLCALSVTITTMVHVLQNATSATKLATLLVIVGV
nr:hypothetical protein [Tanacetum cinerariifolium]